MTQDSAPITPPPELVEQWCHKWTIANGDFGHYLAIQAARWGADQELNECCKWLPKLPPWSADDLRKHRRPKPPSLKEQSIALIDKIQGNKEMWDIRDLDVIRQALESLPS